LSELETDTEVDDALAELKAKLRAQEALPEAKDE
jgi:hypothetical protein